MGLIQQIFVAAGTLALVLSPSALAEGTAGDVRRQATVTSSASELADWQKLSSEGGQALDLGDYPRAEALFLKAVDAARGVQDSDRALLYTELGEACLWQGKLAEAGAALKRAMPLSLKAHGSESLNAARVLDSQSWLYEAQGDLAKARASCRQALELRQRLMKPESPLVADSLEHMGWLDESEGMLDSALGMYSQALAIRQAASGADSIPAANVLERMGAVLARQGKSAEAQKYFGQALSIKESREAVFQDWGREPTAESVVFRYLPGAPNCGRSAAGGEVAERITANGVTVEARVTQRPSEFAKTTRVTVRLVNNSNRVIHLLPQPASFLVLSPKARFLKFLNADTLARMVESKGDKKAKWILFWGADAMSPVTTTGYQYSQGSFGSRGGYPIPPVGYAPPPVYNRKGQYREWSQSAYTTMVPDLQAREEAYRKAARARERSFADASAIRGMALGPMEVAPGLNAEGTLDFEEGKFSRGLVTIPVGRATFEFLFDRGE